MVLTKGHIFNKPSHMGAVGRKFLCVYSEVFGHFNVPPCKIVVSGLTTGVNEVVDILLVSLLVRCCEPISVASLVQGP